MPSVLTSESIRRKAIYISFRSLPKTMKYRTFFGKITFAQRQALAFSKSCNSRLMFRHGWHRLSFPTKHTTDHLHLICRHQLLSCKQFLNNGQMVRDTSLPKIVNPFL